MVSVQVFLSSKHKNKFDNTEFKIYAWVIQK